MKLKIKVNHKDSHYIVNVNATTLLKCKTKAIEAACNINSQFVKENCTAEILEGIPTSEVTFMVKPITKRRLTADAIEEYAIQIGLEPTIIEFNKKAYYWSESQVNQLKQILNNEYESN